MATATPIDLEELVIDTSNTESKEANAPEEAPEARAEAEAEAEGEGEEGAEEGAGAGAKSEKKKRERQIAIPKDSVTFFRARAKNLKMFGFTPDGNLQVPEMRGQPAKVIELPYYRPATSEEIALDEQQRAEKLQGVEREFDETYKLLRAAILEWRQTGFSSDVIRFQRDLQRLDAQRTQLRSPLRWTRAYKNLDTNKLLLEEIYEKRKVGYPVFALQSRMAFETMIRVGKKAVEEVKVEEEGQAEAEGEGAEVEEFIVFSKPDDVHGFLSPDTMVEFIYNSTKYNCILQAYEGERLTLLGRQDVRPVLLKSRNPKQMRLIGGKVTGQLENPRELLINILKSLVTQHPNIGDSLRETGTATLVFAEIKDGSMGVGMLPTDPQITEKAEWKGKNYLGQAWAVVREGLPVVEESEGEASGAGVPTQKGGYTEHGTTKEEATEVRRNVLKGYYRHKKSFT